MAGEYYNHTTYPATSATGSSAAMRSELDAIEAGFDMLNAVWPERDGFQADLDVGRAGSESSNPHLKQAAQDVEQALLTLAMN